MKKIRIISLVIAMTVWAGGCEAKEETMFSGRTMGTTYHITLVASSSPNTADIKKKVDARLGEINRSMSTYRKESEITRFNRSKDISEKFYMSDDFFHVMIIARKLYNLTGGAWDGTIDPLINLWGFGRSGIKTRVPRDDEILAIRANTGFGHVEISSKGKYIRKKKASLTLDLASVAKGCGVDEVARLIKENGYEDFLVEIGGEIYAWGNREEGTPWRVGINMPSKNASPDDVYKVVRLRNKAFATSGDYRNFFEADGRRYSHVLNPATGRPVSNGVVSVSVIADNCAFADGLATALMVMGHEKGIALADRLKGVECLIVREEKGKLRDYRSKKFGAEKL